MDQITADFGDVYADCNEEGLLLKPSSRLPADCERIATALKVSYQQGHPLPEQLESAHRHCYPQLAFFVPDDSFWLAQEYFDRLETALSTEKHHRASLDVGIAMSHINSAPRIARYTEPFEGHATSGAELVSEMDNFFSNKFLVHAPNDSDRDSVRELVLSSWTRMRQLISDWEYFTKLVGRGESGLEPKEVSLARIAVNEKKREIDSFMESLRPADESDES